MSLTRRWRHRMSVVEEIPKGWEVVKIGDVFNFLGGGTPSKEEPRYWNGDLPWASVKDIKGDYLFCTKDKITTDGAENSATNIAYPEDVILVTRINPGKTITSKIQTAINQDLKIIKPKFDTHSDFVRYLFSSLERKCIKLSSGTTVLGITLNNLNELLFPLPPLPEQHRIVAKIEELFSSLDKGIENLKTAQAQLKTYRQAVLKWAFEGKLANKNVKEGELPEGWKWVSLDEIANAVDPQPSHRTPPEEHNGIPYVGIGDVDKKSNTFDFKNACKVSKNILDEHIERYSIKEGDFVIGKIGTIGMPFKIPIERFYTLSANVVLIQPNVKKCLSKFLFNITASNIIENQFKKGSKATTQAAFGIQKVRKLKLPLPPSLDEQHHIVAEIESRLSVCDKLEETITQSLSQAEALRQSILKKAFEGKLVPQDPSDEPANVLLERIRTERQNTQPVKKIRNTKKKENAKRN